MELKLLICKSKLDIILSLNIPFWFKILILSLKSIISCLLPSPLIRSLITSWAIGFFNRIVVLSVTVCEELFKLVNIKRVNSIHFSINFIF